MKGLSMKICNKNILIGVLSVLFTFSSYIVRAEQQDKHLLGQNKEYISSEALTVFSKMTPDEAKFMSDNILPKFNEIKDKTHANMPEELRDLSTRIMVKKNGRPITPEYIIEKIDDLTKELNKRKTKWDSKIVFSKEEKEFIQSIMKKIIDERAKNHFTKIILGSKIPSDEKISALDRRYEIFKLAHTQDISEQDIIGIARTIGAKVKDKSFDERQASFLRELYLLNKERVDKLDNSVLLKISVRLAKNSVVYRRATEGESEKISKKFMYNQKHEIFNGEPPYVLKEDGRK